MTLRPINITTPAQSAAIRAIKPTFESRSGSGRAVVRPCAATLTDGTVYTRAFLNENARYSDDGEWVNPKLVAEIRPSPFALPRKLVAKLDTAGESGMGYLIYTLHFKSKPDLVVVAGNFHFDFPELLAGYDMKDVIGVSPHVGREHINSGGHYRTTAKVPTIDFVFHNDRRAASPK